MKAGEARMQVLSSAEEEEEVGRRWACIGREGDWGWTVQHATKGNINVQGYSWL